MDEIERKRKIYEEIMEEAIKNDPHKRTGEFSVNDFAKEAGIGRDLAFTVLQNKVKAGILRARKTPKGTYYSVI